MKRRKIIISAQEHIDILKKFNIKANRIPKSYKGKDHKKWLSHAMFMLQRIEKYIYSGHRDKAMRWLSCAQGIMMFAGLINIKAAKEILKPS